MRKQFTHQAAQRHREFCHNGLGLRPHPTFDRLRCSYCGLTIINEDLNLRKYGIVHWVVDDFGIIEWP